MARRYLPPLASNNVRQFRISFHAGMPHFIVSRLGVGAIPVYGTVSVVCSKDMKSIEAIHPVHKKILLTYLRLTDIRLGLLINFGSELLKEGIFRVVNGLEE